MSIEILRELTEAMEIAADGGRINFYEYAKSGREAIAELEKREPAAWGMENDDGQIYDCITPEEHAREEGAYTVALYRGREWVNATAWRGLTNDEVNNFAAGCHLGKSVQGAVYEAEARLKEKNT
jgi:hypothetical protein